MNQLDDHISQAKRELTAAKQRGDQPSARHYASELNDLLTYKKNHPDENHDPNSLEVFCDMNPDDPKCRVFED